MPHFSKTSRYTLGIKIDNLFIETTEYIFIASRLNKEQKVPFVQKANAKLDLLKFFLQMSWEIKSIDNKKYLILSEHLEEIGKMLGGWQKQLIK
ncbi:MAG: four helix bundle protein [Candidatus Moranbacteria bacterium]|nr:four helix bundle protein [Candidatus Moranbacteria bacterium]